MVDVVNVAGTLLGRKPSEEDDSKELSPRSSIFTDAQEEVLDRIDAGEIDSHEKYRSFIEGKGFDYDEYHEALDEYESEEGELAAELGIRDGRIGTGSIGRAAGQAWGYVGTGFQNVFPESAERLKPLIAKAVGGEENRQELFFPHATGFEEIVGDITGLAITSMPIVRGLKIGAKGIGLAKQADRLRKGAEKVKKTGRGTAILGGWAIGATAIEKPEDNIVNVLSSAFGDREIRLPLPFTDKSVPLSAGYTVDEIIGQLKVNPDDPKALQYLRAGMNNIIAEGVLIAAPLGILKGGQKLSDSELGRAVGKAKKYSIEHIPTPLKEVAEGTRRLGSKYFTSRFGLNDEGLRHLVQRVGSQKAALTRSARLSEDLERSLRDEVPWIKTRFGGIKKDEKTTNFLESTVNEALAGSDEALTRLIQEHGAPNSANLVKKMRDEIDSMSKYVEEHIATGKLKAVVGDNLGVYLNRSYRIFDDPEYMKNIPEDVQLAARKYFSNTLKIADEDLDEVMKYYMGGLTTTEKKTFLSGLKGGFSGRTSQILRSRSDIAPPIRALWGEVKDPQKNFVNTYRKLANVISEYKFRGEIADAAVRAGKATRETTGVPILARQERKVELEALQKKRKLTSAEKVELRNINRFLTKRIPVQEGDMGEALEKAGAGLSVLGGAGSSSIKDPLKGLFIDEAWKKAIDDGMEVSLGKGGVENVLSHWMKIKALSQAQKTVFSIPTHGRNVMGNMFLMLANGTLDPRFAAKGSADTLKRLFPVGKVGFRMSEEGVERLARYQELGVVDSAVHVGSLEAAARDALKSGSNFNDWVSKSLDKTMVTRGGKAVAGKVVRAYEAEDNLFKIWNFEQMKSAYKKALPNMSDEALDQFVAQRARDVMPNYNLVPKFYKGLRYAPIGNFMAFPLEMIRNSKNIAKYAWKDASGQTAKELGITDPDAIRTLRNLGLKRAAGMTTAVVAGDAAVEQSKQLFGISDEQERAFNKTLPSWARNTNKIFLGPIEKNKRGKMTVDYMNLGPIDPFSYWKTPTKQIIAALMNDQEYNEAEVDQLYNDAMWNAISPFMDPSMIAQAGLDAASGKIIDPKASGAEQIMQGLGALGRSAFVPATYDYFARKKQYDQTMEKHGRGVTDYGYAIASGEVDFPAFLGFKRQTADLSQGFEWNVGDDLRRMNESDRDFKNIFKDYNVENSQEVVDAYMKATKAKYKFSQRLRGKLDAYRALGLDEDEWYKALSKDGLGPDKQSVFEQLLFVDNNQFEPPAIPAESLGPLAQEETKVPVPYEELNKLYSRYKGLPIEFEKEEE